MKNQTELIILLFMGLVFLAYLFPFVFVEAAKVESGVTINAPPPTTGTCPDANNDGVNDMTGAQCTAPASPTAGTCGLKIVSGVPINYGQLTPGQTSGEKEVMLTNEGTSQTPAKLMIKGGNWVNDATGATISGPEVTRVAILPGSIMNKKPLSLPGWELGQMSGGQSQPIYFHFMPWVNVPSGSFHQDVTIDLLC